MSGSGGEEKDGAEEDVLRGLERGLGEKKKARRNFCCEREDGPSEVLLGVLADTKIRVRGTTYLGHVACTFQLPIFTIVTNLAHCCVCH